jgi:ABC-2 type transport system permease protein
MTGFAVMLGKELREQWRTRRLPIVAIVFAIFGIGSIVLTFYLPDLIKQFGTGGVVVELPPPTTKEAVLEFQNNLSQTAILAAILLAMGAVAGERERGVAALLLTKPLGRPAFLLAKATALATTLTVASVIAAVGAFAYTVYLFDAPDPAGFAVLTAFLVIPALLFAAITFLGSVVTGSIAGAAGIGIAALLVVGVLSLLPGVAAWLPSALGAPGIAAAIGEPVTDWWKPVLASVIGLVVALVLAVIAFRRQELS